MAESLALKGITAGYGETHFERMKRYKQTLLIGAVVPTLPNGRVELGADDAAVISITRRL